MFAKGLWKKVETKALVAEIHPICPQKELRQDDRLRA